MALTDASAPEKPPRKFLYKEEQVTLRAEVYLTEKQFHSLRYFRFSDWPKDFINVLPVTILVHREVAEQQFGVKKCVLVIGSSPEDLCVLAAPKFCCQKPVNRAALCSRRNGFVNMEKCDLKVISTTSEVKSPMKEKQMKTVKCNLCGKRNDDIPEGRLFSIFCHFTCRACWLAHCKWELARGFSPLSCPYGDCNEKLTISRAAALLSDSALAIMVDYEWEKKLLQKDNIQCAGCKRWLQRRFFDSNSTECGCGCGCYTCVKCGQIDHTPLRCEDAAVWAEIRSREDEDAAAEEAKRLWSLTRADFEECLAPSKAITTEQYKRNIRFMKTNDRVNGGAIAKLMPTVAIMLESHRVQKLAQRKEKQPTRDFSYDPDFANKWWQTMEEQFFLCLDTLGETKTKALDLDCARDQVMYYYH